MKSQAKRANQKTSIINQKTLACTAEASSQTFSCNCKYKKGRCGKQSIPGLKEATSFPPLVPTNARSLLHLLAIAFLHVSIFERAVKNKTGWQAEDTRALCDGFSKPKHGSLDMQGRVEKEEHANWLIVSAFLPTCCVVETSLCRRHAYKTD